MGFFSKSSRSSGKKKYRDNHHGSEYYKRDKSKSGILGGILGSIIGHSHSHSHSHSHRRRSRHKSSWS